MITFSALMFDKAKVNVLYVEEMTYEKHMVNFIKWHTESEWIITNF